MSGHLERRGKRSWRVKFDCETDAATGRRVTRRVTIQGTRKDAEKKLVELLAARDRGTIVAPSKLLLRDYLETWLSASHVSRKTRERYEEVIRNQVLPHLGAVPLQGLKPAHISRWYG